MSDSATEEQRAAVDALPAALSETQSWEWCEGARSLSVCRHKNRDGVQWKYHALDEDTGGEWEGKVPNSERVAELWEWLNDNDPEVEP